MHNLDQIKRYVKDFLVSIRGLLCLLLLFHLFVNIWWLWSDNHAISTDEETHMLMARDYYKALFPPVGDKGLKARLSALLRIRADIGNPVHPPLLHILGAMAARLLGYSVDHMAFVNTLVFLASIVGVFLIATGFLTKKMALFAAFVFSFTPMIYCGSRYFMTDFLSMALVIWIIYALWRSDGFQNIAWSVAFGILSGFALLARTTVVLYFFFPSLLIAAAGLSKLVQRSSNGWHFSQIRLARLISNAVLVALSIFVIASPWYIVHGGDFYRHWMKPDKGGAGAPLAIVRYENPQPVTTRVPQASPIPSPGNVEKQNERKENNTSTTTAERTQPAQRTQTNSSEEAAVTPKETTPEQKSSPYRWRFLPRRQIEWIRYPVFVINNAVFLPMFLMSMAGIILAIVLSRFRQTYMAWILFVWLFGSYVLLTYVLTFGTPRYAMQALPALVIFSVLPIALLPEGRWQTGGMLAYTLILIFQFGNLTVHPYGPIAEAKLPILLDKRYQEIYDDPGLYFYKPILHASSAYGRMQAPVQDNFKDRIFFAMLKAERERPFYGIEAPYARLNMRGMILDEEHFWLDVHGPNPFRRKDIPPELAPYRNFRHYGWGKNIEEIRPTLSVVDYVVYTTEGISPKEEQAWQQELQSRNFELIERFYEPRYGQVPACHYAVMVRNPQKPLPKANSVKEFQKLTTDELYQLRYSAHYATLTPDLQQALVNLIRARFEKSGKRVSLNDAIDFYGASVHHDYDNWYTLYLIMRAKKFIPINYKLVIRGTVSEDSVVAGNLPRGKVGVYTWSFNPTPCLPLWPQDEFVLLRFPLEVAPIPYGISFGFFLPKEGKWGEAVNIGKIDFGKLLNRP